MQFEIQSPILNGECAEALVGGSISKSLTSNLRWEQTNK